MISIRHLIVYLLLLGALGCGGETMRAGAGQPHADALHVIDGELGDWDGTDTATADGRYIYLTFSPDTRPVQAIQAAPYTTRIRIDADADPATGRPIDYAIRPEAIARRPQGVDLLIELSPLNERGSVGIGAGVTRYGADGEAVSIGHAQVGFTCLPTYASQQYEARIDRHAPGSTVLPGEGHIEIVVDQVDPQGRSLWSTTMSVRLPALEEASKAAAVLPDKPADAVRIMSANVLFSAPLQDAGPFRRVLEAVDPDVILYQEWFRTTRADVAGWLREHAGADWTLHMPDEGSGVAIATNRPIIARYERALPPSGDGRPARACAALIDTRAGELLVISVHLKCCGSADSEEDIARIAQARGIRDFVADVRKRHPGAGVVIGGDYNLVGSRRPLEALIDGLVGDGDDLSVALPIVLGDHSGATWVDDKSRFSPGRLDWVVYDGSVSRMEHALLLDTRVLDAGSLEAMGLRATDSDASDHLPIVVDLVPAE